MGRKRRRSREYQLRPLVPLAGGRSRSAGWLIGPPRPSALTRRPTVAEIVPHLARLASPLATFASRCEPVAAAARRRSVAARPLPFATRAMCTRQRRRALAGATFDAGRWRCAPAAAAVARVGPCERRWGQQHRGRQPEIGAGEKRVAYDREHGLPKFSKLSAASPAPTSIIG